MLIFAYKSRTESNKSLRPSVAISSVYTNSNFIHFHGTYKIVKRPTVVSDDLDIVTHERKKIDLKYF